MKNTANYGASFANMGNIDTTIRFGIGIALIGVTLTFHQQGNPYTIFTALLAIPIIATSILRWCPIYSLLNFSGNLKITLPANLGTATAPSLRPSSKLNAA